MRAVILREPGCLAPDNVPPPPAPGPSEALVRVKTVGICGTDIHAYLGRQPYFTYPRIIGHELGVEVVAVGDDVTNVRPGDRCAVQPHLWCGECVACRQGKTNCCVSLRVLGVHLDGGMQEQLTLPARCLHRSDALTFEQLALAETLAIGAHAVDRAGVRRGEVALVIGAGPIGLSVAAFADLAGATVLIADINRGRLRFASEAINACQPIEAVEGWAEALRERTGGDMAAAVFDATGSAESMAAALQYVAHGGRLVFVSLVQADIAISDPEFHKREATLLATRNSTAADFQRVLPLIESGFINTTPWVTHRSSLDVLPSVFDHWIQPGSGIVKGMALVV